MWSDGVARVEGCRRVGDGIVESRRSRAMKKKQKKRGERRRDVMFQKRKCSG